MACLCRRKKTTLLSRCFRGSYSVCRGVSWVQRCVLGPLLSRQCPAVPVPGHPLPPRLWEPRSLPPCSPPLGREPSMPRAVPGWQGEGAPGGSNLLRWSAEQTSWAACHPQRDPTAPHKRGLQWQKSDKVDGYLECKRYLIDI